MKNRNRLTRYNRPDVICRCCGKRTTVVAGEGTDLCGLCYESAGVENEHWDGYHTSPTVGCPLCAGVSCLHELSESFRRTWNWAVLTPAPAPVVNPCESCDKPVGGPVESFTSLVCDDCYAAEWAAPSQLVLAL